MPARLEQLTPGTNVRGILPAGVLAHLASIPGAEVKITYTLEVTVPSGIPDNTLRTVNENAKSLKIDTHGFQ